MVDIRAAVMEIMADIELHPAMAARAQLQLTVAHGALLPTAEVTPLVADAHMAEAVEAIRPVGEATLEAVAVDTLVEVIAKRLGFLPWQVDVNEVNDRGGKGVLTRRAFSIY